MTSNPDLQAVLDAQPESAFIVKVDGTIQFSTARARVFSQSLAPGGNLFSASADPDRLRKFVNRCSGNVQRCVGSITLMDAEGQSVPFRAYGHRINRSRECPRVFIWCLPPTDERFAFLSKRIEELNDEIRKRRHLQAEGAGMALDPAAEIVGGDVEIHRAHGDSDQRGENASRPS